MKKEWILTDTEKTGKRKSRIGRKYMKDAGKEKMPSVGVSNEIQSWDHDEIHHEHTDFDQEGGRAGEHDGGSVSSFGEIFSNVSDISHLLFLEEKDYFRYDNIRYSRFE